RFLHRIRMLSPGPPLQTSSQAPPFSTSSQAARDHDGEPSPTMGAREPDARAGGAAWPGARLFAGRPTSALPPTGAEPGITFPPSGVDLLGEGLLAGAEGGVAAVDRPDGVPARDRERAPEARLAVGVERHPRHHRVAHEE